ncbi:MAG: ATP-binding protein [Bacteroidales bacterium]|jgi:signal transduction histidine kinase/ActR/RegA family two-component response regulator|nr:ATP-binding protein [Bacteroidales bacterium]MCI2144770.1 ATP-binding protein [Bacteroidales bacterium]
MSDELQIFKEMAQTAKMGWWKFNLRRNTFFYSDFASDYFGLPKDRCSLEELAEIIAPEYGNVTLRNLTDPAYPQGPYSKKSCPFITKRGIAWADVYTSSCRKDEAGNIVKEGYFQVTGEPGRKSRADVLTTVNDLLLGLNSTTDLLLNMLSGTSLDEAINGILKNMTDIVKADRCCLFVFLDDKNASCKYEAVGQRVEARIDLLQNLRSGDFPYLTSRISRNEPVVLNDIGDLQLLAEREYEALKSRDIKSMIAIPLLNGKEVWGYVGIYVTGQYRNWSKEDYQWMLFLTNVISACSNREKMQDNLRHEEEKLKSMNISLTESENMLKTVFSNTSAGIAFYDKDGHPEKYNSKALKIFGLQSIDDLKEYSIFDDPSIPGNFIEEAKRANLAESDIDYDLDGDKRFASSKHGVVSMHFKMSKLYGTVGEHVGYLLSVEENGEGTMVKTGVCDFESPFSIVSESAGIGYASINLVDFKGYANKQFCRNIGINCEEVTEKSIEDFFQNLYDEDRTGLKAFFEKAKEGSEKSIKGEVRIHFADASGKRCKCIYNVMEITEFAPEKGKIEAACANYDITELRECMENLKNEYDKTVNADKLKKAFLSNMNREISSPLNAIVGFSDLLASEENVETKKNYAKIVHDNSSLIQQLISDILDVSKIKSGTIDYSYSIIDVYSLCNDFMLSLKLGLNKGIVLQFVSKTKGECKIKSDRKRLQQVLNSLVTNAIKFTSSGYVQLSFEIDGDQIQFDVKDTGIGIKPEVLPHIFESSAQVDDSDEGTAELGLSICKNIVEGLGGKIGAESELGIGSHFWFRLPCGDIPEQKEPKDQNQEQQKSSEKTDCNNGKTQKLILIAEDVESNYLLLYTILKRYYRIKWAVNGRIAVDMCRSTNPDLILMDLKMPEMDGLDAARNIRLFNLSVPIVATTAFTFESDKEEAEKAGCDEFLTKPIVPSELKKIILKYLEDK